MVTVARGAIHLKITTENVIYQKGVDYTCLHAFDQKGSLHVSKTSVHLGCRTKKHVADFVVLGSRALSNCQKWSHLTGVISG